jgi:hypothetical protein
VEVVVVVVVVVVIAVVAVVVVGLFDPNVSAAEPDVPRRKQQPQLLTIRLRLRT